MFVIIAVVLSCVAFIWVRKIVIANKIVNCIQTDDGEGLQHLFYKNPSFLNKKVYKGFAPLMIASAWGKIDAIRFLLEKGADPNLVDADGFSPLMRAQDVETIKLLLNAHADINAKDNAGFTPLMHAINGEKSREIVTLLLENGANPSNISKDKLTAMRLATVHDRPEIVQDILTFSSTPLSDSDYSYALQYASRNSFALMKSCITHGADVNMRDFDGETPLIYACRSGSYNAAKFLLERGADPNLSIAESATPLMIAAKAGNPEIVNLLIEKGAKTDVKDVKGRTALMYACDGINLKCVCLLLDKGLQVNAKDNEGKNAFLHAIYTWATTDYDITGQDKREQEIVDVLKKLVEVGSDVNNIDIDGNTPLHMAITFSGEHHNRNPYKIMDIFENTNLNLEQIDEQGRTPIFAAIEHSNRDILDWLIKHGANVNVLDKEKISPLLFAISGQTISRAHARGASDLIEAGADVNVCNRHGMSIAKMIFSWVENSEDREFVEKILFRGSIPDWYKEMETKRK